MSEGVISKPMFLKMLQFLKFLRRSELKNETSISKETLSESVEKLVDTANIQNQIIEAIRLKCKVELNYKGDGLRIVCPHAAYISTSGKIRVDSYQVSGYSSHSKESPHWRPFDIAKITELKILNETFSTVPGYDPLSHKYSNAIVKI
jgi:DNA-binding HxlR family transcriptional regulator